MSRVPSARPLLPRWFLRTVAWAGGLLVVGALVAGLLWLLLRVALVAFPVLVALLLAALLDPLRRRLRRALPAWAVAVLGLLLVLAVVLGIGYLVTRRALTQIDDLGSSLTAGVDRIRRWLVDGPLALQPEQVDRLRAQVVGAVRSGLPGDVAAARMLVDAGSGALIAVLVLFFVLKDGTGMWRWIVDTVPARHRGRFDEAGHRAWDTMSNYAVGVVIIALADSALIGTGLFVLGVPLALSLSLLVFLGGFVPYLGALVSGTAAALVTLVTNGPGAALTVVGIVVLVQNIEGNVLQPLVQGRQVRLHPMVILLVVAVGYLLFGVGGAVVAVPVAAAVYRVGSYLRGVGSEPATDAAG